MSILLDRRRVDSFDVRLYATVRADGDMHPSRVEAAELERRHHGVLGRRVTLLDQRHGIAVVEVTEAADWPLAGIGDVMVAAPTPGATVAVWAADCAPLILVGESGTLVAAHAGWRGLAAGVVDVAVGAVTRRGERIVGAMIGPLIHPCCYEFGPHELRSVATGVHAWPRSIAAVTSHGQLALDVPGALRGALAHHGVAADSVGPCTGCDDRWFSHRTRGDRRRHVVFATLATAHGAQA